VLRFTVLLAVLLVLAGCGEMARRPQPATPTEKPAAPAALPFPEPKAKTAELSTDVLFSFMVAEIAVQRSDFRTAYTHYLEVARSAGIAYAAERATRIAVLLKDAGKTREAVALWIQLAPNDSEARRYAAMRYLADGQVGQAMDQLRAMIRIAAAKGEEGFLDAAELLGRESDKEKALGLMRTLVAQDKDDPDARYALVILALSAGHLDEAEANARTLLEQRPDWQHVRVLLSRILVQRGDKQGAATLLSAGVQRYPDDRLLRTAYAQLLVEIERLPEAYEQFLVLLQKQPDSEELHFAVGVLAVELDKPAEARKDLQWLYEHGKRESESALFLGRLEEKQGNAKAAMEWYRRVEGKQYRTEARVLLANLLAQGGKLGEAREVLRQLRVSAPEQAVAVYLEEADLLKKYGTSSQVWDLYSEALAENPGNADLLYSRALYAVGQNRLDILERDLKAIIAQDPKHADALNALGYTLADQTDRYAEALGYIQRALALKPDNPAVLDSMGWVLYRLGRMEEAIGYLKKALAAGFDGEIAAHLGEVLWAAGHKDQARKVWRDGLAQDPENKYIRSTMQRME